MLRDETPILNQYCRLAPPKTFIDSIGQTRLKRRVSVESASRRGADYRAGIQ